MVRSRTKVTVVIECRSPDGELTASERWDIIVAAATATRAAIERYVAESHREKASDAIARIIHAQVPANVRVSEVDEEIDSTEPR